MLLGHAGVGFTDHAVKETWLEATPSLKVSLARLLLLVRGTHDVALLLPRNEEAATRL